MLATNPSVGGPIQRTGCGDQIIQAHWDHTDFDPQVDYAEPINIKDYNRIVLVWHHHEIIGAWTFYLHVRFDVNTRIRNIDNLNTFPILRNLNFSSAIDDDYYVIIPNPGAYELYVGGVGVGAGRNNGRIVLGYLRGWGNTPMLIDQT